MAKHASGEVSPDAAPIEDLTPKSAWKASAKAVVRNEGLVGASGATLAPATDGPGKLTVIIIEAQGLVVRTTPFLFRGFVSCVFGGGRGGVFFRFKFFKKKRKS